jgi:Uma2 family endonuclease
MSTTLPPPETGPAWDIARLFPDQGYWDEDDYLALETNHFVEFTDGHIEVLPMPTLLHQRIMRYVRDLLWAFIMPRQLGEVVDPPYRIRLRARLYREPDLLFVLSKNAHLLKNAYATGADLVMEIVSEGTENRQRDLKKKRKDYEQAGIPEYWIIDPRKKRVIVLTLKNGKYLVHGEFAPGQIATSVLLDGFTADVAAVFAAAEK